MSEAYRCTARKRSGDFCDKPPVPLAPFPICAGHLTDAIIFAQEFVLTPRQRDRAEQQRRDAEVARVKAEQSVVYYARESPGVVKIGFTTNVAGRMADLRLTPADLMATEPGGRELEKMRHGQFKHLRVGRWERFTLADDLASHIEMLVEHYGQPTITKHARVEVARSNRLI